MVQFLAAECYKRGGDEEGPHDEDGVGVLEGQRDPAALLTAVFPVSQHVLDPLSHDAVLPKPDEPGFAHATTASSSATEDGRCPPLILVLQQLYQMPPRGAPFPPRRSHWWIHAVEVGSFWRRRDSTRGEATSVKGTYPQR